MLSKVKKPTNQVLELFKKALTSPDDGLKYQAAALLGDANWRKSQCKETLIQLIKDKNNYVVAAAITTLSIMKEKGAIQAILARKKKYDQLYPNGESGDCPGLDEIEKGIRFSGWGLLFVLDSGSTTDLFGARMTFQAAFRLAQKSL